MLRLIAVLAAVGGAALVAVGVLIAQGLIGRGILGAARA